MRTLEEVLAHLTYKAPTLETLPRHQAVSDGFDKLVKFIYDALPDGPGKTVALRSIETAKMQCNNCIANNGS